MAEAGPVDRDEPHAEPPGQVVVGVAGQARVRGAVHVDDRPAVRRADVVGGQGAPVGQRQPGRGPLHARQRRKMAAVIPVVTPEEMAAIDRAAPEPVEVLIDRAGAAVARAALELLGGAYGRRVVVVAGKGNNGADGRAAARPAAPAGGAGHRDRRGRPTRRPSRRPTSSSTPPTAPASAASTARSAPAARHPGARGRHPFRASTASPGGPSGAPLAADRTVTFAALKPGLLLADGAELAGEVTVADIGLDTSCGDHPPGRAADVARWLPRRPRESHKWKAAVWVVAGSPGMTGAAHLTTRAAQRGGAGYVRLSTPGRRRRSRPAHRGGRRAAAGRGVGRRGARRARSGSGRSRSVPASGTGPETAAEVRRALARCAGAGRGRRRRPHRARHASRRTCSPPGAHATVLTPHDGELARLGADADDPDRIGVTRAPGGRHRRGGAPEGLDHDRRRARRHHAPATTAGDARLATAGTGDVLTGLLAALLAQGVPPLEAAAAGRPPPRSGRRPSLATRPGGRRRRRPAPRRPCRAPGGLNAPRHARA